MPVVKIDLWEGGLDDKSKEKIIQEVSRSVSENSGAPIEAVEVIINEINKSNWGKGGIQASKIEK